MATILETDLTPEQHERNAAAAQELVRGKYYDFHPPVEATGIPTGGKNVCPPSELEKVLTFSRGWYIGYIEKRHVFQGTPKSDPRNIPVPRGYEDHPDPDEIVEQLRACYFYVAFLGGSAAVLSPDQNP